MRSTLAALAVWLAACGPGDDLAIDARVADARIGDDHSGDAGRDGRANDGGADATVDAAAPDAAAPYRHTLTIDGRNDFVLAAERIDTTSAGYFAHLSWDTDALYLGYQGADVAGTGGDAAQKWLFAVLDVDPGAATGARMGQIYNTETPAFPTGFGAEFYLRWKTSDDFLSLEGWNGTMFATVPATITHARSGNFVEFRIPLSALGSPPRLGVVTLMMNETANLEAAYAGLYPGTFTDGYHASVPIAFYLDASFASPEPPSAAARHKP